MLRISSQRRRIVKEFTGNVHEINLSDLSIKEVLTINFPLHCFCRNVSPNLKNNFSKANRWWRLLEQEAWLFIELRNVSFMLTSSLQIRGIFATFVSNTSSRSLKCCMENVSDFYWRYDFTDGDVILRGRRNITTHIRGDECKSCHNIPLTGPIHFLVSIFYDISLWNGKYQASH